PRSGKPLYRDSHAVVVGINEYKGWPKLSYAVNDAQAIRDVLVNKFLFKPQNVHLLLNGEATRERILSVLGDSLADTAKVDKDDRVFFFFAGHGVTRKLPNGGAQGYIVPVDADTKNFQAQAISMTSFQDVSEAIPAKHIFYVMDACYSGLALTRGANAAPGPDVRKYLEEITRRATRQVLTAGGSDEQVSDRGPNGHSIFTWTLLQGLEGRADANADGYVTATELASYVAPAVSSLSQQTPAFGSMVGSEGGEFVLELNHEGEFLSDVSGQLDQEAVQLNTELERIRKLIAEKEARNKKLAGEVALASAQLASLEPGHGATRAEAPSPQDQARRENDRGMALYREKKYAEALGAFERAAQLDPQDAQAANNVGFILFKLERVQEALPWLEKTVTLSPSRAPAYVNLGDTYDKLGRKADALRAYRRYLELMPTSPLGERVKKRMTELQ
ncbi:MAG TPA: caspase family protein, partial [Myxococcaceae bacterium]|nr:caspase family protein [Myxococcaceae bacterium]